MARFYEFDLMFMEEVIATQPFLNMTDACEALKFQYREGEIIPGYYTIVNKVTGESASLTFLEGVTYKDVEEIKKKVFNVIADLNLDLDMSMLDIKIEPQLTCRGCKNNQRGFCLKYIKMTNEAKNLCYKENKESE